MRLNVYTKTQVSFNNTKRKRKPTLLSHFLLELLSFLSHALTSNTMLPVCYSSLSSLYVDTNNMLELIRCCRLPPQSSPLPHFTIMCAFTPRTNLLFIFVSLFITLTTISCYYRCTYYDETHILSPFVPQHVPLPKYPFSTSSHSPILFLSTSISALFFTLHTSFNYNRRRYLPPPISTLSISLIHTSPLFYSPPFTLFITPDAISYYTRRKQYAGAHILSSARNYHSIHYDTCNLLGATVILEDWRKEEKYLSLHLRVRCCNLAPKQRCTYQIVFFT